MRDRSKAIDCPEMTGAMMRYLADLPAPPPEPAPMVQGELFTRSLDILADLAAAEAEG